MSVGRSGRRRGWTTVCTRLLRYTHQPPKLLCGHDLTLRVKARTRCCATDGGLPQKDRQAGPVYTPLNIPLDKGVMCR